MANLLPTKERYAVRAERYRRLALYALGGLAFTALVGILLSSFSYVTVRSRERVTEERLAAVRGLIELAEGGQSSVSLFDTRTRIDALNEALAAESPHALLLDTIQRLPNGVTIWHVSYLRDETGSSVVFSGRAATRDALLQFGDALRQSGRFATVDIPVGSLAQSTDVSFSLQMTLTPPPTE